MYETIIIRETSCKPRGIAVKCQFHATGDSHRVNSKVKFTEFKFVAVYKRHTHRINCPRHSGESLELLSLSPSFRQRPKFRFEDTAGRKIYYDFMTNSGWTETERVVRHERDGEKKFVTRARARESERGRSWEEECRFHPPRPGRDGRS